MLHRGLRTRPSPPESRRDAEAGSQPSGPGHGETTTWTRRPGRPGERACAPLQRVLSWGRSGAGPEEARRGRGAGAHSTGLSAAPWAGSCRASAGRAGRWASDPGSAGPCEGPGLSRPHDSGGNGARVWCWQAEPHDSETGLEPQGWRAGERARRCRCSFVHGTSFLIPSNRPPQTWRLESARSPHRAVPVGPEPRAGSAGCSAHGPEGTPRPCPDGGLPEEARTPKPTPGAGKLPPPLQRDG